MSIDELDCRLLVTMRAHPRIGLTELARLLGVARGTVQARVEKLTARGVISDFGPTVAPEGAGYPILAFVSLQIAQGRLEEAVRALEPLPEILEVYGTSGQADLLCRVVARSTPTSRRSSLASWPPPRYSGPTPRSPSPSRSPTGSSPCSTPQPTPDPSPGDGTSSTGLQAP